MRLPSASLVKLLLRSVTVPLLWGSDGASWGALPIFPGSSFSPQQHPEVLQRDTVQSHMVPATVLSLSTLPQLALDIASWNLSGICCSVCLHSAFGPVCDLSYLTCKLFGRLSYLESAECHLFGPI